MRGCGWWVVAAVWVLGCEEEPPAKHPVAARAPFDLDCPSRELNFEKLDEETFGVSGCGRRATYVRMCHDHIDEGASLMLKAPIADEECKWVLNGTR